MSDKEETAKFRYEQDSKRFHRFKIESESGIVGSLYIPKDGQIPQRLVMEREK